MLMIAAPAQAQEPVEFGSSSVVDSAGVLSSSQQESVEDALSDLARDHSIHILVAFVDEFENPSDRTEWTQETAELNQLGDNDGVLGIAVDQRLYSLSVADEFPLSDDAIDSAESELTSLLADDEWSAAVLSFVSSLSDSASGSGDEGEADFADSIVSGVSQTVQSILWVVGIAILVIAALVVLALVLAWRRRRGVVQRASRADLGALQKQAGAALVALDDAVRTSEQEVGFAAAQYGDDATVEFRSALDVAKRNLATAFTIQQKLDDEIPDTDADRRAWLTQILQLVDEANRGLDAKSQEFEQLRQVEKNAPQLRERLGQQRNALCTRAEATANAVAMLQQTYDPSESASVADNVSQAQSLLAFVDERLQQVDADLAASRPSAALPLRLAEQSLAQAQTLLQAVDALAADLQRASADLPAAVTDLDADLAAAEAIPQAERSPQLAGAIAAAQSARAQVSERRPRASLDAVATADAALEAGIEAVQQRSNHLTKVRAQLSAQLTATQATIETARDFIQTRRGAVGVTARTRLAEAERAFGEAQALSASDPEAALSGAQGALSRAQEALRLAQQDVGGFGDSGSSGGSGPTSGGGGSGSSSSGTPASSPDWGAVLGGIVLGGLLGGSLCGGSRRGGPGFGGFGGGMPGGHGGGFGGFGGGHGGGFGGGGHGGGFGGGRGGGGRF